MKLEKIILLPEDDKINSVLWLYSKSKPQVFLGKLLINKKGDKVYFMYRFTEDKELRDKFYQVYNSEVEKIFDVCVNSNDIDELILNLQDVCDYDLKNDYDLSDLYEEYDWNRNKPYKDSIFDNPIDIPEELDKEIEKVLKEDDDKNLQLALEIADEIENEINELDKSETEDIKEKYQRKGFRKDAKNPLIPIKITTKTGVVRTYYIRKDKLEKYEKENKKLDNNEWKYKFYTDEISKFMRKDIPEDLKKFFKNEKYGLPSVMTGSRMYAEKLERKYGNRVLTSYHSFNGNVYKERLVGKNIRVDNYVYFIRERVSKRGNKLLDVKLQSNVNYKGNKYSYSIYGTYTDARRIKKGKNEYNSFHIKRIEGNMNFDNIIQMTLAHSRTSDMITLSTDNDVNLIKRFVLAGYGFDKDTEKNFKQYKDIILRKIDNYNLGIEGENVYKSMLKSMINKSNTFQDFILNLLREGKREDVNYLFKTDLIEYYKDLTNSRKVLYRTHTLSNVATKSEKILETFLLLRDESNDYHLGYKFLEDVAVKIA